MAKELYPLGEAVAVRGLPASGSDVDVVGPLAGGGHLRLLPAARFGLLWLSFPSCSCILIRIAQLLLPSRPLAIILRQSLLQTQHTHVS